ncbi:hypothetical protein BIW53_02655 [Pseudoalteromonas byunsanensis]|uniref:Uncharacterized protein n=2 Tax=Pseudoalteromonas byunsanensis TaxID=327939 RepID=A0A1S1NCP1_9GAMM|nr:hypothetical protein BIW53_02655 [Pseudoalteromonas byunsanensis]
MSCGGNFKAVFNMNFYKNYIHFISIIILLGFVPSYILQYESLTLIHHFHALLSFIWLVGLNVQPVVVVNRLGNIHKAFGWFLVCVGALMLISTLTLFISTFETRVDQGAIFRLVYLLDLFLLPSFVIFMLLAIVNRKHVMQHISYVVLATIMLLPPGLGRLIYGVFLMPLSLPVRLFFEPMVTLTVGSLLYFGHRQHWHFRPTKLALSGLCVTTALCYVYTYWL